MNEEETLLKQTFDALPTTSRQLVQKVIKNKSLESLLKKYQVDQDNVVNISDEAILVLLGIESKENFRSNLTGVSNLDASLLDRIAQDIDNVVFQNKPAPTASAPLKERAVKQTLPSIKPPTTNRQETIKNTRGNILDFLKHEPGVLLDEELGNQIRSTFTSLPQEKQEFILNYGIKQKLQFNETKPLKFGQMNTVENELLLVLLGMEEMNMLATNITHNVQIARERAEIIARVMKNSIIQPFEMSEQNKGDLKTVPHAPYREGVQPPHNLPTNTPQYQQQTPTLPPSHVPQPPPIQSTTSTQERVFVPERQIDSMLEKDKSIFQTKLTHDVDLPKQEEREVSNATGKTANDPYRETP